MRSIEVCVCRGKGRGGVINPIQSFCVVVFCRWERFCGRIFLHPINSLGVDICVHSVMRGGGGGVILACKVINRSDRLPCDVGTVVILAFVLP